MSQSAIESECNVGDGGTCKLKLPTPPGLKDGDVVLVFVAMAGKFEKPPAPPDNTWTELPLANQSGATSMVVGSCGTNDQLTAYAYAHVYGSATESGTYKFTHVINYICNSNSLPDLAGSAFAYRAADPMAADYVVNGYSSAQQTGTVTLGPAPNSSPSDGTLINVFNGGGCEGGETYEQCGGLSGLTGSPLANWETLIDGLIDGQTVGGGCFAAADVGIPATGTAMNQYSANDTINSFHTFGWQVLLPPQ